MRFSIAHSNKCVLESIRFGERWLGTTFARAPYTYGYAFACGRGGGIWY